MRIFLRSAALGLLVGLSQQAGAHVVLFDEDAAKAREEYLTKAVSNLNTFNRWWRAHSMVTESFNVGALSGKRVMGQTSWIPDGTRLADIDFPEDSQYGDGNEIRVLIDLPKEYLASGQLTEGALLRMGTEIFELVRIQEPEFEAFMLYIRDPETGDYRDAQEFIAPEKVPPFDPGEDLASYEMSKSLGKQPRRVVEPYQKIAPVMQPGLAPGALSGKTVYINQSHGWFDDPSFNRYRIQRGNCYGVIEDFDSPEFLNLYVIPMLRNAGAKVQAVREMDMQTNMVIVDNADGTSRPANGTYAETGTWTTSTINGFIQKTTATWSGVTVNPFNQGAGANRLAAITTGATPTATATWTAVIPADGYYNVYASWTGFSARARDAQYLVHHSGGVSEVRVDQRIDGYTWNLLGNFYFERDAPADQRKVVLTNQSSDAAATNVSADAVRWGGGMGDVARQSTRISNRPRWEEEAVLYLQFNGFGYSGTLYAGTDDEEGGWSDRPQYARWEHSQKDASVEDAIYFAFHTNALSGCPGGVSSAARGLSTFRHSSATAASASLQTIMHDTMYAHVAALYVPGWTVRGKSVTNFGENNQSSLGTGLPGFLIEGLFHDNEADTLMYKDPQFRYLYSRSMVQGIINYFEARDSVTLQNPPEPPRNFRIVANGNGSATLSWDAPLNNTNVAQFGSAATGYRVQRSRNGFGFDDGVAVTGTSTTISGLPTEAVFFRVIATNSGGWSVPSETLCAAPTAGPRVLIVNGFDRNQRSQLPGETVTNAGSVLRLDPRRFQAFNYIIEHGRALAPHGVSISSASNESVASGQVPLTGYRAVFWIAGEESTTDEVLSSTEQSRVQAYLQGGGNFFISGSEIGWDLDSQGSTADRAFFNGVLRTAFAGDSANTYNVTASGAPFSGMAGFNFLPGSGARYNAESPDQLAAINGSRAVLSYSGGAGGVAALAYDGPGKLITVGFPFETISSATVRQEFMRRVVEYFGLNAPPDTWILR